MEQRVLLLADTHGVLDERIAALSLTCEYALHAGDIGNASVLSAIRPVKGFKAIVGNNDVPGKWPQADLERLQGLPGVVEWSLPGGMLVAEHGHRALPASRRHEILRQRYPHAKAIVYGHSHRLCLDCKEEPWILNPGAAGRARTFGGPSCILLTISEETWHAEAIRFPL